MEVPRFLFFPPLEYSVHISLTSSSNLWFGDVCDNNMMSWSLSRKHQRIDKKRIVANISRKHQQSKHTYRWMAVLTNSYGDHKPWPVPTTCDYCEHWSILECCPWRPCRGRWTVLILDRFLAVVPLLFVESAVWCDCSRLRWFWSSREGARLW